MSNTKARSKTTKAKKDSHKKTSAQTALEQTLQYEKQNIIVM